MKKIIIALILALPGIARAGVHPITMPAQNLNVFSSSWTVAGSYTVSPDTGVVIVSAIGGGWVNSHSNPKFKTSPGEAISITVGASGQDTVIASNEDTLTVAGSTATNKDGLVWIRWMEPKQ